MKNGKCDDDGVIRHPSLRRGEFTLSSFFYLSCPRLKT